MEWYQKSADQGNVYAKEMLKRIKEKNAPQPTATAKPALQPTETLSAEEMYAKANSFYEKRDYKNALPYYEKAAEAGHRESQYFLGYMYQKGLGVKQSEEKAIEWYQKSADQGNVYAKEMLKRIKEKNAPQPTATLPV